METRAHTLETDAVLAALDTSREGLSEQEARKRLARDGRNELPPPRRTSLLFILLRQFAGPLIAVLLVAAAVSMVLGDYKDAAFIGAVLLFNALIGFFQEAKAEREIIRLFSLLRSMARVERENELREIDASELVVGDIVWLESGSQVPADMRVVMERDATIDEALLTGESIPVSKHSKVIEDTQAIPAEQRNMLFAGTSVTRGRAQGVVTATGIRTELGGVSQGLEATRRGKPPLVLRMEKLSKLVAVGTVVGCAVVFGLGVARGFGVGDTFLMVVALAVAAIPEGLPVAITLALAIGLKRMTSQKVLIRRLEAVEGLGSCTVICTDKTGTLTLNQLTVTRIATVNGLHEVTGGGLSFAGEVRPLGNSPVDDAAINALLTSGCLANEASVATAGDEIQVSGDPTDIAILVAGRKQGLKRESLLEEFPEVATLPFESERQFMANYVRGSGGVTVHVKGAPERVLDMATNALGPDGATRDLNRESIRSQIDKLSSSGLRVLGVARGSAPEDVAADNVPTRPTELTFLGLLAMRDAPRAEAKDAVTACHTADVRVIVVTGDHAQTAMAVAVDVGIAESDTRAVTGREVEQMDDDAFQEVASTVNVFARVTPQHKLRLVQALQKQGELVAMTGDGANDAAALKAAHIGVAMGHKGTDVAKQASQVIIADDNFASIVGGIKEGRIVGDNVRNVVALLVMTGAGEVLAILLCLMIGLPVPLTAAQLLWANLATEGLQVIGLAMEPGEPDVLSRPPRPPNARMFDKLMITRTVIVSIVIAAVVTGTFWYLNEVAKLSPYEASNLVLLLLVLIENVHIGNCRSERRSGFTNSPLRNPWVLGAAILAQGMHLLAMHWRPTQELLRLEPVSMELWFTMFALSLTVFAAVELHKLWQRFALRTARTQDTSRARQ